jgi:hypothetical protein
MMERLVQEVESSILHGELIMAEVFKTVGDFSAKVEVASISYISMVTIDIKYILKNTKFKV